MSALSDFFNPQASATPTSIKQNTVTPYAQPLATQIASQAQALGAAGMPAYTGELTAGPSALQNQAFSGLANLTLPSGFQQASQGLQNISNAAQNIGSTFTPTNFTNTYTAPDTNSIQQYMNPYLQASLAPQLQLLQDQLGAQNAKSNAQLAQAGAYGGGRQAIVDTQNALNSNLLASNLIGQGYNTAYNTALGAAQNAAQAQAQANQFQQTGQENAAQFGANLGLSGLQAATSANQALNQNAANQSQYGLANLQALQSAGAQEQAINQAADTASYNQYLQQLQYPQTMLTAQENAFNSLPTLTSVTYGQMPSAYQNVAGAIGTGATALNALGSGNTANNIAGGIGTLATGAGNLLSQAYNGISSLF